MKFGAEWCAPCKAIAPILQQIADDWDAHGLELWQVDVMTDPLSAEIMRVRALPTLILFVQGKEVARLKGYHNHADITAMIKEHVK